MLDENVLQSSQTRNDNKNENSIEKKKFNDGATVINDQMKAIEELKKLPVRKFRLEKVAIDTLSGKSLYTKMWVTDEEFFKKGEKEKESFKCEICEKEFDKKSKLTFHMRYHK
jgi:hypothetical protein